MATRTFELKPAVRERVPLLIGLAGPSGGGKTWSGLRLATGIQRVVGGDIAVIDTESKRALHYSDHFRFRHVNFQPPHGSLDYLQAITTCVDAGARVVLIDSTSHEHEGVGGMVDFHEEELTRMAGDDFAKRERCKMLAWAKPKAARRKFIAGVMRLNCNLIFCFRTKSVSKPVKVNGKTEVVPQGFTPISGEELVYEMTLGMLLLPKSDGFPTWESEYPGERMAMKLPAQFRELFAKPRQLTEDLGEELARWAAGANHESPFTGLLKSYDACRTRPEWDAAEKTRAGLWKRLAKADQHKAKAASEAAFARLTDAAAAKAPPDAPEDHIPGVGDPAHDALFDQSSGVPHQ